MLLAEGASILAFLVRETDAAASDGGEGDWRRERRAGRGGGWGETTVEEESQHQSFRLPHRHLEEQQKASVELPISVRENALIQC